MTDVPTGGSRLGRTAAVMAAGTLASRLTGFVRVFALAAVLGAAGSADTYNLANTLPNIVYELVLGGVLGASLVQLFRERLATRSEEEAERAIGAVVAVTAVAAVLFAVVLALAAPLLIDVYSSTNDRPTADAQRDVGTFLLRLFAPQLAAYGFITLATALLHTRERFAATMWAPVLNNVVVVGMLATAAVVAGDLSDVAALQRQRGVLLLLGLGTTAGIVANAVALVPAMRRARVPVRLTFDLRHEAVRRLVRLGGWTVGFTVANQLALQIVLLLANAEEGALSAYQYAFIVFLLPHSLVTVSVMSAVQPKLATAWATGDVDEFRARTAEGLRLVATFLLPAAAGYALVAHPLVRLVFLHGETTAAQADRIADTLVVFALGIPGFSAFLFLIRGFTSMAALRTVFLLYVLENAINVVLAALLFDRYGAPGLAAAYGAAYVVAAAVAAHRLGRRTGGLGGAALRGPLVRVATGTLLMGGAVAAAAAGVDRVVADGRLGDVAVSGVAVLVGVTVYAVAARALGIDDLAAVLPFRRSGR